MRTAAPRGRSLEIATRNRGPDVVAERHLGVPQSMADAFGLLQRAGIIGARLAVSLQGIVGFCNVAVHQEEQMDMNVLR